MEEIIMLVLSRKVGQSIVISGRITLTVSRTDGAMAEMEFITLFALDDT